MPARIKSLTLTEQEFLTQVLALAKLHGWRSAHFRPLRTAIGTWRTPVQGDGAGFPDLVLVRGQRLIFAELKTDRGETTPNQDAWLEALRAAHVEVYIWRPDDWDMIERILA